MRIVDVGVQARGLVAVTLLVVLAGCSGTPTDASSGDSEGITAGTNCAAPSVAVRPARVSPGQPISIVGFAFVDGCDDAGVPGCDEDENCFINRRLEDQRPLPPQRIRLSTVGQGSSSVPIGTARPDADGEFRITATAPDLPPGNARIVVGTASQPVRIIG